MCFFLYALLQKRLKIIHQLLWQAVQVPNTPGAENKSRKVLFEALQKKLE